MSTGFTICAFVSIILNLILPEEIEDDIIAVDPEESSSQMTEQIEVGGPGKAANDETGEKRAS